jgi:anti-anti-sigma factor
MARLIYKFGEKIFLGNADGLGIIIDKMFEKPDAQTIVFDLENVKMCDSYGLKFLINYQRKANTAYKTLLLYRPDAFLTEMLSSTKLTQFFSVVDTLDDKVSAAGSGPAQSLPASEQQPLHKPRH